MGTRTTTVTAVLAIAGVIGTWLLYRDRVATPVAGGALTWVSADEVVRVTLRRDGGLLAFARDGEAWAQVEPFAHPMDPFSMRQLSVQAGQLEIVQQLDADDVVLGDVGLSPPAAVLTCETTGDSVTLQFGRRTAGGRTYVRLGGDDAVYIVRGELTDRVLDMDPREWRDRTIFPRLDAATTRIEIDNGAQKTVVQRENNRWRMTEPLVTRVDEVKRTDMMSALGRARSDGFVLDQPDDLERFGLASPAATLTIVADETQRLLVGNVTGIGVNDRFAIVEGRPVVVKLSEAVLRALFPATLTLVDPTGTGVLPADVMSIAVRADGREFVLRRDLDKWLAPAFNDTAVPAERVDELLQVLTTLRAAEVVPREFDPSGVAVTLYGFGGTPLDTVRLALDRETGGLVLDNGDFLARVFPGETSVPLWPTDFGIELTEGVRANGP